MAITVGINGQEGDRFALLTAAVFAARERVTLRVVVGPQCDAPELDELLRAARQRAAAEGIAPAAVEIRRAPVVHAARSRNAA